MSLIDRLKQAGEIIKIVFPKPNIPQKRYILILVGILYIALKGYVKMTPSTYDDELLEHAHKIALQVLAQDEVNEAKIHYGESS
jgi:hypothetical protein